MRAVYFLLIIPAIIYNAHCKTPSAAERVSQAGGFPLEENGDFPICLSENSFDRRTCKPTDQHGYWIDASLGNLSLIESRAFSRLTKQKNWQGFTIQIGNQEKDITKLAQGEVDTNLSSLAAQIDPSDLELYNLQTATKNEDRGLLQKMITEHYFFQKFKRTSFVSRIFTCNQGELLVDQTRTLTNQDKRYLERYIAPSAAFEGRLAIDAGLVRKINSVIESKLKFSAQTAILPNQMAKLKADLMRKVRQKVNATVQAGIEIYYVGIDPDGDCCGGLESNSTIMARLDEAKHSNQYYINGIVGIVVTKMQLKGAFDDDTSIETMLSSELNAIVNAPSSVLPADLQIEAGVSQDIVRSLQTTINYQLLDNIQNKFIPFFIRIKKP